MVQAKLLYARKDGSSMDAARNKSSKRTGGIHPSTEIYINSSEIAKDYDAFFRSAPLFQYDGKLLSGLIHEPGPLVDLGCGTGRHTEAFVKKGFFTVGVDLSHHMLDCVRRKTSTDGNRPRLINGDLCRLGFLRDGSFRYAICMFSTIGMIRGKRNRARFVREIRRILRPGGLFVFHVHNRWLNLFNPCGRSWLVETFTVNRFKGLEPGDKIMDGYRGIPDMFLHVFSYGEARRLVEKNGFTVTMAVPLNLRRDGPLKGSLRRLRANGFIIAAEAK